VEEKLYEVEDFWKFKMKIGEILSAEKIKRTRKLIKLLVNFGNDRRIIITGVGDQFDPTNFVNKKMIFVTNLKPKKIAGIESQAMLLVAEEENGKVHLISVDPKIPNGVKVW